MRITGLLTAICIILLGSAVAASADNSDGAITPEMIEKCENLLDLRALGRQYITRF